MKRPKYLPFTRIWFMYHSAVPVRFGLLRSNTVYRGIAIGRATIGMDYKWIDE